MITAVIEMQSIFDTYYHVFKVKENNNKSLNKIPINIFRTHLHVGYHSICICVSIQRNDCIFGGQKAIILHH